MPPRAPYPSELKDCALAAIHYLRQVNTLSSSGGMKILVIGGYALKQHLNGRDTTVSVREGFRVQHVAKLVCKGRGLLDQ